jgi:hypothetical protein
LSPTASAGGATGASTDEMTGAIGATTAETAAEHGEATRSRSQDVKPYKGKIALDIRDSTPDWEPFLPPAAPEAAPNVLMIAWDDVGHGTMELFGGPVETPTMARIADMGVRFGNFHTTALCSPTRASLLTGRNATSNGMATIAEFSSGFPGISCRIPFENGSSPRCRQSAAGAPTASDPTCRRPAPPTTGYGPSGPGTPGPLEGVRDGA